MSKIHENPVWYPYAQMKDLPEPLLVKRARGTRLYLEDGTELVDAIASWWCVIHGYNHPELNQALREQLSRMSHVMLGGLTHEPALKLAKDLVRITPSGLNHVFFSDSGSVGVEVALKMAAQYWRNQGDQEKSRFLALKNAYHGDTWMAMTVCDPEEGMHALFSGLMPTQRFVSCPEGGVCASEEQIDLAASVLRSVLEANHREIAAFILEPVLQAAGGFHLHSPAYLAAARALCDEFGVLLIFDEVATGFGRTGKLFAAEYAGVSPDIMVLGKGLTAGYLGHAATLASDRVAEGFHGPDKTNAFMHGPTFMGNPLACAVARKSIELCEREDFLPRVKTIEELIRRELLPLASGTARDVRVLGAMGAVEVRDETDYQGLQAFARKRGVWLRPFDRYVYLMPPCVISDEDLLRVTGVIRDWFTRRSNCKT